jgi:hypothetical protein
MKRRKSLIPIAGAAGALAVALAGTTAHAQQTGGPRTGIVPAREDRVFKTVLELLRSSGPADDQSIAGGELMARSLTEQLTNVNAKLTPLECYHSGCWIQVVFGAGTEEEIAKHAFQLNVEMSRDPKAPLSQWTGPKGRTALLYDDAGVVFEGFFVFVRSRAVSPGTRDKHQIKVARPMDSSPQPPKGPPRVVPPVPPIRRMVTW